MLKKKNTLIIAILCIVCGSISFFTAFYIYKNKSYDDLPLDDIGVVMAKAEDESNETEENNIFSDEMPLNETEDESVMDYVAVSTTDVINPSTKIVYQYYYTKDGVMKEMEDVPDYFLLGLSFEDMMKYYTGWQIISFSKKEVVMRQIIDDASEKNYIIGEHDGYVAVFYEQPREGISLHEITDKPVSSLNSDEQERLKEGISIKGDYELSKILEDYGS